MEIYLDLVYRTLGKLFLELSASQEKILLMENERLEEHKRVAKKEECPEERKRRLAKEKLNGSDTR